jgi:hypothetical protein
LQSRKHFEAADHWKNNFLEWIAVTESPLRDSFDRRRNFDLEKPTAWLKPWKLSEAKVWCKGSMKTDVIFRENLFVDDWIIENDRPNGIKRGNWTKRGNRILGRNFRGWLTYQEWFDVISKGCFVQSLKHSVNSHLSLRESQSNSPFPWLFSGEFIYKFP